MKCLLITRSVPPSNKIAARRWGNLIENSHDVDFDIICEEGDGFHIFKSAKERIDLSEKKNSRRKKESKFASPIFDKSSIKWIVALVFNLRFYIKIAKNSDILILSYGPAGPLWFGWFLSFLSGTDFIIDFRDCFESRRNKKAYGLVNLISVCLERKITRSASAVITISDKLADYIQKQTDIKPFSIYNGWVADDKISRCSKISNYLYYAGTVYEHRLESLVLVLEVMQDLTSINLKIRCLNPLPEEFIALIHEKGLTGRVEILGSAPENIVKAEMGCALGVLVLEDVKCESEYALGTVTGKLLGLLVSGVPGIAFSARGSEIERLTALTEDWDFAYDLKSTFEAVKNRLSYSGQDSHFASGMEAYSAAEMAEKLRCVIQK
ncbi:hypothetical protein [Marinobacterium sp. xm-a-152]|uniref:hypothetical protein n=1 Tax=Marinobacterium sp. xm-a-152 TaxID=2497733 RepID=UPI00156A2340|nr:hypothetical protein [Marinobacterium sp. xm-a-152]NRP15022.1 hypothetical protein [Marinobacterium sp. xm-a-152]